MTAIVVALVLAVATLALLLWVSIGRQRRLTAAVVGALEQADMPSPGSDLGIALDRAFTRLETQAATSQQRADQASDAIQAADFGVIIITADGEIAFSNVAADRYLEARHGDAVAELRMRELMRQVTRERRAVDRELEIYNPTRRQLGLHAVPIGTGPDGRGAVIFIEDLSERHRVDVIRQDFVANASHELKTPLGALSVLAEALADADDPEIRRRLAGRLGNEAHRMSRLIDDILDLALVEGDPHSHKPVSVDEMLVEAERQVALSADQYGIAIETKPAGAGVLVACDRVQIVALLANLLENAVKYTHVLGPGAVGMVWLRAIADDKSATFEVEDHGIGIPDQHQDRIFERFYRVDRARSRDTGGTGLGLAIASHAARNHDTTIEVDSSPGVGTTFRFTLPRWEE